MDAYLSLTKTKSGKLAAIIAVGQYEIGAEIKHVGDAKKYRVIGLGKPFEGRIYMDDEDSTTGQAVHYHRALQYAYLAIVA